MSLQAEAFHLFMTGSTRCGRSDRTEDFLSPPSPLALTDRHALMPWVASPPSCLLVVQWNRDRQVRCVEVLPGMTRHLCLRAQLQIYAHLLVTTHTPWVSLHLRVSFFLQNKSPSSEMHST